jgi:Ca2+-binding RTX toxin-like protein
LPFCSRAVQDAGPDIRHTAATDSSDAGDYSIIPVGLTSTNYAITFVEGVLTVTPEPLTVTAQDATKVAGQDNPPFTASAGSPAGAYAITPSGLTSTNYAITFVDGVLTVTNLAVQFDPLDPTKSVLVIGGGVSADVIRVRTGDAPGSLDVVINEIDYHVPGNSGSASPINRIVVHALAGDDNVHVAGDVNLAVWLYGGAGNDRLKGGAGNDVLLGGDGDDLLVGSNGRDLLIGGMGRDRIVGNADDDILIAGRTAFDSEAASLAAILAEWSRQGLSYQDRILHLRAGGGYNGAVTLNTDPTRGPVSAFDDEAADVLTGGAGSDWFFANLDAGVLDTITDLHGAEFADDLDFIGEP